MSVPCLSWIFANFVSTTQAHLRGETASTSLTPEINMYTIEGQNGSMTKRIYVQSGANVVDGGSLNVSLAKTPATFNNGSTEETSEEDENI